MVDSRGDNDNIAGRNHVHWRRVTLTLNPAAIFYKTELICRNVHIVVSANCGDCNAFSACAGFCIYIDARWSNQDNPWELGSDLLRACNGWPKPTFHGFFSCFAHVNSRLEIVGCNSSRRSKDKCYWSVSGCPQQRESNPSRSHAPLVE